jgi:hypothetical protein
MDPILVLAEHGVNTLGVAATSAYGVRGSLQGRKAVD